MKKATVLLLLKDSKILLAMKKRGFGMGKWNGVGGKPDVDEDIVATAVRESQEEIGVTPLNPCKVALFKYYFPHDNFGMQVWIFTAVEWNGEPTETEEMRPLWFNHKDIPYDQMWSDDEVWMPEILAGKLLSGSFMFDKEGKILDYYIEEVESIE
ncbi:hypothetical protein A2572_03235 [Candidatus Collierbacteria bacterium RIFOXYD1_FULL_40_9]|uniref:Oxidized purine nucleoside triphosphate hydrolase n=1 Tax=Candidatus Collierbacteria bacterium RIFOXYD1_FULL_40_9 TaxID=1817731 RepID=A0A1F5FX09_9BACT|nr:MAG: hypothetical protein A2572_03235 [Candidatus Collierbacteria bacterium RIFOXYD1_FULL_40_9]